MPVGSDPTLPRPHCPTQGGPAAGTNAPGTSPSATTGNPYIKGTVTGSGGTPFANIEVDANSSDYGGYAMTASDGTYSVAVAAGSYTVSFYDNSGTYLNGYYSSGGFTIDYSSATPVAVTTSDVTGISVQLGTGHSIKGTVTGSGGTPLANIRVQAYTSNRSYYGYATTASDGTYSVAVPAGSYTVYFYDNSDTYLSGYYSSGGFTISRGSATPVAVTTSDVTGISVQLQTGYYIKGTVTGSGGTPLANIQVEADSSDYYGYAMTASDGTYSAHVAAGSYTVSFYDNSGTYLNGYYSSGGFTISRGSATPVAVTTSDVTGISVQLGTGHSIKGTVTGSGGTPLANIEVDAYTSDSSYSGYAMTASDGTYSVAVPAGSYTVHFRDYYYSYLAGYYSSGGFVIDWAKATAVSVGSSDVTGINVTLWPSGATYHAITPTRVLDTRNGTGGLSGPFTNHAARQFVVTGGSTGIPSNATAVTGNLTVTGQTSSGYLFIGPVPTNNPGSSTLNFPAGDDRANAVTVAVTRISSATTTMGFLSITFVAPSNGPSAQAIFDVTGYFTPDTSGATYHTLNPTRLLDTRNGTGGLGVFSSHVAQTFAVTGHGGVPSGATAVTGNLTVTGQTSLGYLSIGPVFQNNPTSSTLNFPMNDDRANAVTVALDGNGKLSITYAAPTSGPTAHVIFDVTGYFTPDGSGASYVALTPTRLLDSRNGTGLSGAFSSHSARPFQVTGLASVPGFAIAVTGNLTVTQQTSLGYLYIGPQEKNNPTSSTLNFPMNDDRANAVTVALNTDGSLAVTYAAPTSGPTAHAIFDVTGYFVQGGQG